MNKDDILLKSRNENKDRDLYAQEIQTQSYAVSSFVALFLATALFIVQVLINGAFNFGLYAIVFSFGAASFVVKAARMRRKRDIVLAFIYTAATVIFTVFYIYQLLLTSANR